MRQQRRLLGARQLPDQNFHGWGFDRAAQWKLFHSADLAEGFARSLQRRCHLRFAMRRRHEARFVRRRREIHALPEHGMKKAIKTGAVALHDFGERFRRRLAKIETEHTADRLRAEGDAGLARFGDQGFGERCRRRGNALEEPRLYYELRWGEPRRDGERISRERARLVDRAERRELLHDVATAPERAERQGTAGPPSARWHDGGGG